MPEISTNYLRMLEEERARVNDFDNTSMSPLEYLSDYVFDFTTYDSSMAELLATQALEVCGVISSRTSFDYIEDSQQYYRYLMMVNMPFFVSKLEWGTSIRGAWWQHQITLRRDDGQLVQFTREQWIAFVVAMQQFVKE